MEPRIGGGFVLSMTMADGRIVEIAGTYREIVRLERLVFSWGGGCHLQSTVITLTFRSDCGSTLMTLRQDGFESTELCDGFGSGWSGEGGSFDKLDAFLARTKA